MKRNFYAAILATSLVAGCGSSDSDGASVGTTITLNPSSITWTASADLNPGAFERTRVTVSLVRGEAPLANTEVELFLDLSDGTTTGGQAMVLRDTDGTAHASPYKVTTDSNGIARVLVDVFIGEGTSYTGSLSAYSGAALGSMTITVSCEDGTATCP